jgi:hypothetical protein
MCCCGASSWAAGTVRNVRGKSDHKAVWTRAVIETSVPGPPDWRQGEDAGVAVAGPAFPPRLPSAMLKGSAART